MSVLKQCVVTIEKEVNDEKLGKKGIKRQRK
jgi:hypothetical protein